jgi:hypothetical protein
MLRCFAQKLSSIPCSTSRGSRSVVCCRRWYTGGPAGGSGQEVIAPGQGGPGGGNKAFEDLRQAVEPHARQGTSEDLAEESSVFTGAARTLDGESESQW